MILVTTPSGKVGQNVVREMLERGQSVRIGAHTPHKAQAQFPGTEVMPFDFADEGSVRAALEGVQTLYLASPGDMAAAPVLRLIGQAEAAGVRRIVRLSAMGVEHGEGAMRDIERALEASALEWTILRPNWFMQNYSTGMAGSVAQQSALYEPAEEARTSFIDARDIAAVAVQALLEDGHAGQGYTLTGPEALDRDQVAGALSRALNREVRYVPVDDAGLRAGMRGAGATETSIELMSVLYAMVRAGYTEAVTSTVERLLGRAPISLEQFVQEHTAAWKVPQPVA